jgi:hypothetical protein
MQRAGVEVVQYAMSGRLQRSQVWLKQAYKAAKRSHPDAAALFLIEETTRLGIINGATAGEIYLEMAQQLSSANVMTVKKGAAFVIF